MKLPKRAGAGYLGTALSLLIAGQVLGGTARAEVRPVTVVPAAPVATVVIPATAVCAPVAARTEVLPETVTDTDTVYSPVNDPVITHIPAAPAVVAPLDTIKLQINNRMNSGLLTGQITNSEADDIRTALDNVERQEADFKLGCGLTQAAVNNLMRKYHMINQQLDGAMANSNYVEYMPSFEIRRAGLQRRIQYHLAAGNLTPTEAEQLLAALSNISDVYNADRATGGTLSGAELEELHRDLSLVYAKLTERVGGTIAFTAPASSDKLAQLRASIITAESSHRFSDAEIAKAWNDYNGLVLMQKSIVRSDGARSADIQLLAKQIDDLNFILTRELHDRQIAGVSNKL